MKKTCEYQGKLYTRNNSKWVDKDHMVVPVYLQHILNTLTFDEDDSLSYEEAKSEGDKHDGNDGQKCKGLLRKIFFDSFCVHK